MRLEFLQEKNNNAWTRLLTWLAGVLTGLGAFLVFLSALDLSWGPGTAFSGSFSRGAAFVWNRLADTLGRTDFIILPKYSVSAESVGVFLTVLLVFLVLLAVVVVKSGFRALLLIFAMPPLIMDLLFGISCGFWQAGLLMGGLILSLAASGQQSGIGKSSPGISALGLSSLALGLILAMAVSNTVGFTLPAKLRTASTSAISSINDARYGSDTLKGGQLNCLDGREKGSGTALEVTMSQPESYYLRGFVGEDYTGSSWESLPISEHYDDRDKYYWLNKKGFSGLTELSTASKLAWDSEQNGTSSVSGSVPSTAPGSASVSVKVINGDRRRLYVPYELSQASISEGKDAGSSFFISKGLRGASSYSYRAAGNLTGSWTDWVGRFYSAGSSDELESFFTKESHYNVLQYELYTDVPTHVKALLKEETGSDQIKGRHADYKEAISEVRSYLNDNYIYTNNFNSLDPSKDFLENFRAMRKGCDVHYASMATMLFRYYGIPARFVEGYLVTPSDVKKAAASASAAASSAGSSGESSSGGSSSASSGSSGGSSSGESAGAAGSVTVKVPASNIHAWTEIYVDGFGWVPIEVSPDYYGVMQDADMSRGLKQIGSAKRPKRRADSTSRRGAEKARRQPRSNFWNALAGVLLAAIALAIAILLAAGAARRGAAALRRRKAFRQKDARAGTCAVYQYMIDESLEISDFARETGNRAAYSLDEVTESDRLKMIEEYKAAKKKKRADRRHRSTAARPVTEPVTETATDSAVKPASSPDSKADVPATWGV